MQKKISFSLISVVVAVVVGLIYIVSFSGCKQNTDVGTIPNGTLVKHSDCKLTQGARGDRQAADTSYSPGEDCIQYSYDGIGRLTLKHINAAFNCCPGSLDAELAVGKSTITVFEKEQTQGCYCLCLYDLDYQIDCLTPGVYTIRVVEPYVQGPEKNLEFTIELKDSFSSGSICVPRSDYPWN